MIRIGIVSRNQIAAGLSEKEPVPQIACTVLEELDGDLTEEEEAAIDRLYQALPGGPTNLKFTRRRRYQSVDRIVIEEMVRLFPVDSLIRIHDMAASSAITSLEFFVELAQWNNIRFHATDYYDTALIVSVPNTDWRVVFDNERRAAQFIGKRLVISAFTPERKRYPANMLIQRILKATILPRAIRILDADEATRQRYVREIRLFHPKCIAMARTDSRFTLGRHNILESDGSQYEVVRLMGVVGTFPSELIEPMLRKAAASVAQGGMLVVGRSDESLVPTSIFQRQNQRLVLIRDLMGGYLYKDLVLGLDLSPSRVGDA